MAALHRPRLRARSGCSDASGTRSRRLTPTAWSRRCAASSPGNLSAGVRAGVQYRLANRNFVRLSPVVLEGGVPALRRGQIDAAFSMGVVGHHMITFSREALRGEQNASFYSAQEHREGRNDGEVARRCASRRKIRSTAWWTRDGADVARFGSQRDRPQRAIGDVLERHGQRFGRPVDRHMAEELQPVTRREIVALRLAWTLYETRPAGRKCVPSAPGSRSRHGVGPETNSQNGSKFWNTARFGS